MTGTTTVPETAGAAPAAPAPGLAPEQVERMDGYVARARVAADAFRRLDQEAVDRIVWAMVVAGLEHAIELAELAMEETGFGVFEDKVVKNYIATEFLYDYLKDKRSVGVIDTDVERGIEFIAEPIGVVLALLPITNPTSTALFKAIVGAKTRNAMLFRPSARAARCALRAIEVLQEAGEAAGLPPDALQVIPDPTLDISQHLFHHDGVDFIWTTGGPKAVAATNAAGKPCMGVGSGNAPVYVHRSADLPMAVVDILVSKTFDASVICPAEQTCIVDDAAYDELVAEFERMGARLLTAEETDRVAHAAMTDDGSMRLEALGRSCVDLAALAGIEPGTGTKVLLAQLPTDLDGLAAHPLIAEKLMPVLGLVRSPSLEHGIAASVLVTEHDGLGHTSAVYARDEEVVRRFSLAVRTGRILVNAPTAVGALGGVYNSMTPTFSLGCGTWGGSTTTDNINYRNLLNVKTVSRRQSPPQWFRVPSDTYFNPGSLDSLRELHAEQVVIVTDQDTERRGVAEEVRAHLPAGASVHVFADISPEPPEAEIRAGVRVMEELAPDVLLAIGGGSVIDAAKAIRLFHESPQLTMRELALPFLDARKRVAHYPQVDHASRLIAVPTTAGTGSEVSPAAVLTVDGRKVTLVDYSLVPDMAVVEPKLTTSMPPFMTADTGVDALTHALEAAVSIFASPFTDAFCMQAMNLIFEALPRAYADGEDLGARTAMSNAATIAGLAFSNAFVGVNHALAHAVGARFGIAHGRANAIFLPHVLRYNASLPSKFMPAPGYSHYVAPEKYAQAAWILGVGTRDEAARREALFARVDELLSGVGMPGSLAALGIPRAEFEAAVPDLARAAFIDPSIRTNPRIPMLTELVELLWAGYEGR
ncbi:bifunctional acetaldehyde-CoA/alcohol dehydrogenase [Baekduia soli]|uniref:alcohol dehydrogenase n=1 Tax=Baekduia soli TaxID=496014 RepID=A0A5B8U3V0_9ACTN|nr:bifunctional acetaldehyde-CoA/alcohol dehydrogenase [Baekduia soli]QEC47545.1 bifunctional acetaldehyde-CoA/alcohol dehydrogenase [Baekduia soli]